MEIEKERTMTSLQYTEIRRRSLPANAAGGVLACAKALLHWLCEKHQARIAARQLQSLSDWQLKDIGMYRSQIWYLAGGISARSTRITHAED
jgi:uncharacterized protein YjiS (DUF1127 family)